MTARDAQPSTVLTGTMTFLLTEIESKSRLREVAPEAMTLAVRRYHALLDDAVKRHGGNRPQIGEGDSEVCAFGRASDTLAAALDAQRGS